jgi:hypothetical protein
MLDLSTAVLCDFAQVRDRLLFVSSGAVSRLYRQELPSPLGLMVGLVIEVPLEDAGMDHQLRAEVINRHGTVLATLENTFRVSDVGLFPHEVQQVPLVLSITGVRARTWGTHQVRLYLDGELVRALTLYVVPAAGPQAQVRATPTQSRVADAEGSLPGGGEGGQPDVAAAPPVSDAPSPLQDEDTGSVVVADQPIEALDAPIVIDTPAATPDAAPAPAPAPEAAPEPEPEPEPAFGPSSAPEPEPAPPAGEPLAAAPPAPEEALDWGDPAPAPAPAASPDPTPPPPVRQPTIDAPMAYGAPAPEGAPEPPAQPEQQRVFDYEDDLDADPSGPPPEQPDKEPSRFSFRYLVDDE